MTREVPARAGELAGRLSALFVADSELACRLNDAQHRLLNANEQLWSGLLPAITVFSPGLITRIPQGGSAQD